MSREVKTAGCLKQGLRQLCDGLPFNRRPLLRKSGRGSVFRVL